MDAGRVLIEEKRESVVARVYNKCRGGDSEHWQHEEQCGEGTGTRVSQNSK